MILILLMAMFFWGGYIGNEFRDTGYGAVGLAVFISYLFKFFPLRKIYFEAFEYNGPSLSMLQNFGFVEEGRFKKHRFYNGGYHDVLRFALHRDCISKVELLLSKLEKRCES